ncbi:hypothetical protein FA15DRAFT_704614 [Coprinopsis marcescibilis]|uniref:Uncharacterized protein n=1 Tax=Coprinopsis marcescibilis TaxID=230819 RepID=A0A5C3KVY7_COPMA|nr:hypothetical protein FA15DRAFT_704614 [Coprinopsis marcescibilis]
MPAATVQSNGSDVSTDDTARDIDTPPALVEAVGIDNEPISSATMLTVRSDELTEVGVVLPPGEHRLSQFPVFNRDVLRRFTADFHDVSERIILIDKELASGGKETMDVELRMFCERETEARHYYEGGYTFFVDHTCSMSEAGASLVALEVSKWKKLKAESSIANDRPNILNYGTLAAVVNDGDLNPGNSHVSVLNAKAQLNESTTPVELNRYFAQITAACVGSQSLFGGKGIAWSISDGITWIFGVYLGNISSQMESTVIGVCTLDVTSEGDGGDGVSLADIFKLLTYWTLVEPEIILSTWKKKFLD